jgi:Domain of unknown function (DUF1707)
MATRTDLRIGDADREASAASLREHYAQGRLSLEEFNERLNAVFAATTRGQLDAITRDLPHVTTPYVPLPVTVGGATGDGGGAGYSGAGYGGRRSGRSGMGLLMGLVAVLAIWFFAAGPMMAMHFHLFSWPGRFSVLLAGLMLLRSLVRRLFGGRRRWNGSHWGGGRYTGHGRGWHGGGSW